MKFLIINLLLFSFSSGICQTPVNDSSWVQLDSMSDEFNGNLKSLWSKIVGPFHGISLLRINEVQFSNEGSRQFLKLEGRAENGMYYTGGIMIPENISALGFGYYEIEARLDQTPGVQTGFWPTFWTMIHGIISLNHDS